MEFSAGRVLGRAASILRENLVPFLVLALIVFAPVFAVALIVAPGSPAHWADVGTAAEAEGQQSLFMSQFMVGMLAFLAYFTLAGALSYGVLRNLAGQRVGTRDAIANGLRGLIPVIDVSFVTGILVGIGFLLLVVPGAILACVSYVAVPTAAVERPDVFRALRRSAELTRGHRPAILVILLATLGLMFLVGVLMPGFVEGLGRMPAVLLGALAQFVFGLYGGICQNVAYHDLRVVKEAATSAELAPEDDRPETGA